MTIYQDISNKLEAPIIEAIAFINGAAEALQIPFFMVGAKARDVLFSAMFNIRPTRATLDVDLAVQVHSWQDFERLTHELLQSGRFQRVINFASRYVFNGILTTDIIPFGDIEEPEGKVTWPSADHLEMSTLGFSEAFEHATIVRLKKDPELLVKVSTAPGIVVMKLIAWNEKYPLRDGDAKDIFFIMKHYIDAGNDQRLYDGDSDLVQIEGFDYGLASARMLGRDMAKIGHTKTLQQIVEILNKETSEESTRLVSDMIKGEGQLEDRYQETREYVHQLKLGILDHQKNQAST